jgi:hypothetical protein
MNKDLLDYVKQLTQNDTKTLSQKLGKLMEETGELASVVLPYDGAAGTLHRFIDRQQILEEIVDALLCSLSMGYQIGCTDDDIIDMMLIKCNKWGGLQSNELRVANKKIPYEIHVTVSLTDDALPLFTSVCQSIGVKPIVIDLRIKDDSTIRDVMTSSVHFGDNKSAYLEMLRISDAFNKNDSIIVVRQKIETVPWHPAAPQNVNDLMPTNCYFEAHINVEMSSNLLDDLYDVLDANETVVSSNFFKNKDEGELVTKLLTLRSTEYCRSVFNTKLEILKTGLKGFQQHIAGNKYTFNIEKEIVEFAIYDTKISHDSAWIVGEKKDE